MRQLRSFFKRNVKTRDKDLLAAIEADAGLRWRTEALRWIPGVGPATAARLLAAMPDLGGLGRRAAGTLLDVCPLRP